MPLINLPPKFVRIALDAVEAQIKLFEARAEEDPDTWSPEDDFGNDAMILRGVKDEMEKALSEHAIIGQIWEGWHDPVEHCTSMVPAKDSVDRKDKPWLLGENAELQYRFFASTYEEAASIHNLRLGFGPYNPMGEPGPCPHCKAFIYPLGSGDCWRCGKTG